jgi:8-oxo-dGTP pyrophosphatase MutT (NUDIX family)
MSNRYRGAGVLVACRGPAGYEVLLGRRRIRPFRGYWSIPGGRREARDRTFVEAALRELSEELCGDQPVERFLAEHLPAGFAAPALPEHSHRTPYLSEWHTFLLVLTSKIDPARLSVPNHEFSAADWFPVEKLPDPSHPGVALSAAHFRLRDGTAAEPPCATAVSAVGGSHS